MAGIGLLTSKLNLEIPLWKQRTSLLLSGRTTYSDWILGMLPEKSGYKDGKAGFYDVGATFSHTLNERNKLNIYGYFSRDRFAFSENEKYGYENKNGERIVDCIYDDAKEQNEYGYISVKKDGLWGCLNKAGQVLVETRVNLDNNLVIDFIGQYHLGEDINLMYYTINK